MPDIYRIAKRVNYPVSIPVKDNTRAKTVVVSMHFRLIPPRAPLPPSPPAPWGSFQPSGPWRVSSGTISRRVRSSPVNGVNLSACPACGAFRPSVRHVVRPDVRRVLCRLPCALCAAGCRRSRPRPISQRSRPACHL